jgi:hypothetical protein
MKKLCLSFRKLKSLHFSSKGSKIIDKVLPCSIRLLLVKHMCMMISTAAIGEIDESMSLNAESYL